MSSRPNDGAPASGGGGGRDSTANLLRLFKAQPDHHVVTRQDLTRDYDCDADCDCDGTSPPCPAARSNDADDDGEVIIINNYYTWNSSKTNASILKQRAAIISELHSVKSASASPSPPWSPDQRRRPPSSADFIRSHRVRDIVAMCSDVRHAFHASDEYLQGRDRDAAVGTVGRGLMDEYARERSVDGQWPRCLALGMTCATAVYGGLTSAAIGADEDDHVDDVDEAETVRADEDGVAATTRTWKRVLSRLFRFTRKPDD